jgi:hypothetical protein
MAASEGSCWRNPACSRVAQLGDKRAQPKDGRGRGEIQRHQPSLSHPINIRGNSLLAREGRETNGLDNRGRYDVPVGCETSPRSKAR